MTIKISFHCVTLFEASLYELRHRFVGPAHRAHASHRAFVGQLPLANCAKFILAAPLLRALSVHATDILIDPIMAHEQR